MRVQDLVENKIKYDNPGGEWLRNKQEYAKEMTTRNPMHARAGVGAITAYTPKPLKMPIEWFDMVRGARDEKREPGEYQFDALMAQVQEEGFHDRSPVLVAVDMYGKPWLVEGNTRVAVARAIDKPYVMTEIRWWNGSEESNGLFSPKNVEKVAL